VLLKDISSIKVNHSSKGDADSLNAGWQSTGQVETYCYGGECEYVVRYLNHLPAFFIGDPDGRSNNRIARFLDHFGLRKSMILASVRVRDGVVVGKGFREDVTLPVQVWFDRGGAYVPDLTVSSGEIGQSNDLEAILGGAHVQIRRYKGPWGLGVSFDSTLDSQEKTKLGDFHLQCITVLSPCLDERQILPEGARLLEESEKDSR
jgi:hypothetical protein